MAPIRQIDGTLIMQPEYVACWKCHYKNQIEVDLKAVTEFGGLIYFYVGTGV